MYCICLGLSEQDPPPTGVSEQDPPTTGVSEQDPPTTGVSEQDPPTTGVSEQDPPTTGVSEQDPPTTGVSEQDPPTTGVSEQDPPTTGVSEQDPPTTGVSKQDPPPPPKTGRRSKYSKYRVGAGPRRVEEQLEAHQQQQVGPSHSSAHHLQLSFPTPLSDHQSIDVTRTSSTPTQPSFGSRRLSHDFEAGNDLTLEQQETQELLESLSSSHHSTMEEMSFSSPATFSPTTIPTFMSGFSTSTNHLQSSLWKPRRATFRVSCRFTFGASRSMFRVST